MEDLVREGLLEARLLACEIAAGAEAAIRRARWLIGEDEAVVRGAARWVEAIDRLIGRVEE